MRRVINHLAVERSTVTSPLTFITNRLKIDGGEVIEEVQDKIEPLINPNLRVDAVSVYERQKNGTLKSVNTSQFIQPSFEEVQAVTSEVERIDDVASFERSIESAPAGDSSATSDVNSSVELSKS